MVESVRFATEGLVYALRTQRNLRVHMLVALLVTLLAVAVQLSRFELALLVLTVAVVMAAELVNTAVEAVVDLISPQTHDLARVAKNVAAGGVLVTSIAAVAVGLLLFYRPLVRWLSYGGLPDHRPGEYLVLIGTALVLLVTWITKTIVSRPPRLVGGMPSGHAAVAFALAAAVFFISRSGPLSLLAVVLAGLVGQSRLEGGLHTLAEVAAGAALGAGLMALVFLFLG